MIRRLALDGVDPVATLAPLTWTPGDTTRRRLPDGLVRAVHTPAGPGTVELRWRADGEVTVTAWGEGAEWLLDRSPHWLGLHDDTSNFAGTDHPTVRQAWRTRQGLRLAATGLVWSELVPTILAQRVTSHDAGRAFARLCRAHGEAAPGPHELILAPAPAVIARLRYHDFHRFDVERRRADALIAAARHAIRLEEVAAMERAAALQRLLAVPGLGPWTATSVITVAHGDPDVVLRGDFWLPSLVTYNLTGDPSFHRDDDRALGLLAPFVGHRWRVCRLLLAAGSSPPRRAPRPRAQRIAHL